MKKIAIALIVLILIFGGGFLYLKTQNVTIAIVSGSATISSPTMVKMGPLVPQVDISVKNVSQLDYMLMKKGKPRVTSSKPTAMTNVVDLTIKFTLKTPTGTELTFEPLKIGEGGEHNFELIIGPNEGLQGTGNFTLTIEFHLKVTTPAGVTVTDLTKTITVTFTIPSGETHITHI